MNNHRISWLVGVLLLCATMSTGFSWDRHGRTAVDVVRPLQFLAQTACVNSVAVTSPAPDLAARVAQEPAGTCFSLANGTYTFHDVVPKDDMVFVGASTAGVVVDGRGYENAFHGTADNVSIARMTFQDFNSSAGTKRQEQSPIRGTARLWASDRGQMATNWVVDSVVSQRNYAAGIFVGDHFIVRNSIFRNNGVTGMSGDSFVGGLFENNIVHGNGAFQQTGVEVNGGGLKFGQAGTPQDPVVVRNNEVYDNPNIGIWCDIGCQGFHVIDNYIHDHVSRGVMYELSSNLVVRGNRIERSNTWTNFLGDFNAGAITVGESAHAVIENNHIQDAQSGVVVRQTKRPAGGESFLANYPTVNYVTSDVLVRNNVHVRVRNTGISTGVTGNGLITNPGSISYVGNSYDDLAGMSFWWNNGQRLTAAQWQAAGRDVQANASGPTSDSGSRGPDGSTFGTPTTTQAPAPSTPLSSTTQPAASRPLTLPIRINTGGPALVDAQGVSWAKDTYYVGGNTAIHAQGRAIANTDNDELYREERWGAVGYDIPVAPGEYLIRLHHAEVFDGCQNVECRRFSISIEGQTVISDVDLYAEVGGYSALVVDSITAVSDGELTIRFSSSRQNAQISGIEVLQTPGAVSQPERSSTQPVSTSPAATTSSGGGGKQSSPDHAGTGGRTLFPSEGEAHVEGTAEDEAEAKPGSEDSAADPADESAAHGAIGDRVFDSSENLDGALGSDAAARGLSGDEAPSGLALELVLESDSGGTPWALPVAASVLFGALAAAGVFMQARRHRLDMS